MITLDYSIDTAMETLDYSIHRKNRATHLTTSRSLHFDFVHTAATTCRGAGAAHSSYHLPRGRGCKQNHRAAPQSYITKGDAALADSSDEAIPLLAAALVQVHLNDGLSAPTATLVQ